MEENILKFKGSISVKAVLESGRRKCRMLYVDGKKRSRDFAYIIAQAKKRNVPVVVCDKPKLNELADGPCAGILLEAETRDIPDLSIDLPFEGFAAFVDGVEDPYNLGSITRTLYAAGCSLLILPRRNWDYSESTIVKASAGAWEKMNIVMLEDVQILADWKNRAGLKMVCAERKDAVSLFDYSFAFSTLEVIGGSRRGIHADLLEQSDANVYIPYGRDFKNALDAPSAAAVMAFAWTRQYPYMKKED
ncbi:MAG: RNA methyltransferase [Erysipelotrichaceae bacterium]|nr:RNA methyltransferase [Erysipelotrichaceae bacterium]